MRKLTPVEQANAQTLESHAGEVSFVELTSTGHSKGIMDATGPVRLFLRRAGLHDFEQQGQGEKVVIPAALALGGRLIRTRASFYRPLTKLGDPRMWVYGLTKYVPAGSVLAFFSFDGLLYVADLADPALALSLGPAQQDVPAARDPSRTPTQPVVPARAIRRLGRPPEVAPGPLAEILSAAERLREAPAIELLEMLRAIARRGPIPAVGSGDTAVGRTLESALGIAMNASPTPDYRGIELKSSRATRPSRSNLFAQVPDWSRSRYKGFGELLERHGYERDGRRKLYVTVRHGRPNRQGLALDIDEEADALHEVSSQVEPPVAVLTWGLAALIERLRSKHRETFWVTASEISQDGYTYFTYERVEHTRDPLVYQLPALVIGGAITLDHLVKAGETPGSFHEKGPLFKIRSDSRFLLFPPSRTYAL